MCDEKNEEYKVREAEHISEVIYIKMIIMMSWFWANIFCCYCILMVKKINTTGKRDFRKITCLIWEGLQYIQEHNTNTSKFEPQSQCIWHTVYI